MRTATEKSSEFAKIKLNGMFRRASVLLHDCLLKSLNKFSRTRLFDLLGPRVRKQISSKNDRSAAAALTSRVHDPSALYVFLVLGFKLLCFKEN